MTSQRRGTAYGVTAYLIWGLFPLYWPLLEPSGAVEILAHRVVWSLAFVALLLVLSLAVRSGRLGGTLPRDRRRLGLLAVAAVAIGVNWGIYIWGVNHQHVVETSLGYFVNPLVTVTLAVVVLGERLRRSQWAAVGVATLGVVALTIDSGRPPWIALSLAVSFGTYGLVKKVVGVGAVEGLVVETAILAPLALVYLAGLASTGRGTFTTHGAGHALLIASSGVATGIPLIAFAAAASRVPLTRLGVLQYMTPTIQFLLGVLLRHEPLPAGRLLGFVLVWIALIVFTVDSAAHRRRQLVLAAEAMT